MPQKITVDVPLNRVEGDLQVRAHVEDGVVVDAWCSGTMFRGIEQILVGRDALDGLVITPRVCGICSTSHLTAASRALDQVAGLKPPPSAVRVRNVALMAEHIQSDVRHGFLTFTADFANAAYRGLPLYDEAVRRYAPFRGETVVETIRATKHVLEIVAILGGQWPHASFMVPGGIASRPSQADLTQCRLLLRQYRDWYEKRVLGCSIERWLEVRSTSDLEAWIEEAASHGDSDLGFFVRFAGAAGLDRMGQGTGTFLSYGSLDLPEGTSVKGGTAHALVPAGFAQGIRGMEFDQSRVAEHVASSFYMDQGGGRHPFEGETRPYATGPEGGRYSWAKAPRYDGLPAETGPLAEAVIGGNPLVRDLVEQRGPSAFVRELARLTRPTLLFHPMEAWLAETRSDDRYYTPPGAIEEGDGHGLLQASRGALGHWVRIRDGRIQSYQIVTPTGWNASPRDGSGTRGPMEEALVGTPVKNPDDPVELGHVVRSFDACLVCTVHVIRRGRGR